MQRCPTDSKADASAVSKPRLTLDFSTVLGYDGFGSFTSSLLGSLLSFETGENRDSETERCARLRAGVMELVDVADSKSAGGDSVGVRVPPPAPNPYNPNLFPIGDGFGLLVFFKRYESTHFRNGVERKPTSKPRGPRLTT